MTTVDLALTCVTCGRSPARLRIGEAVLCAPCAHAMIDRVAPPPAPPEPYVSPRERVLEQLRHGPTRRGEILRFCTRADRRALDQLVAEGAVVQEPIEFFDVLRRQRRDTQFRLVSQTAAA